MNDNKAIEKKLHNLIIKRQTLINEKKELLRQISFTKARLLLPENQNSFYKHELSTYEKKLNIVIKKLEISSKIIILLFSKLRIVKINLKKDNYLERIVPTNNKLSEAIEAIECYGCIETGEIFDGPKYEELDIPVTSLDKFESTSRRYRENKVKNKKYI